MRYPLLIVVILTIATVSFSIDLEDVFDWSYVDFNWGSEKQKEDAIKSGKYNPEACVLYDVDKAKDGRIFVTAVREEGVPASLMTVSNKMGQGGPLLDPYPDWSWYDKSTCDDIISVYRVSIKCNRLFVLDCGTIGTNRICPAKLLIFDLSNDRLIKRIHIPDKFAQNANGSGLLVTPLAYVQDCHNIDDPTVFMADVEGFGLVIYNKKFCKDFCRIESTYMEPTNPDFTIRNQSFYLEDGILGLTIIYNELFYSDLGGNSMYKINMCNKPKCTNIKEQADKLTQLAGKLSGQTAAIASKQCALFFSNIPETSILCQDATKEFTSNNTELIVQNSEKLQFVSGMKVTDYRFRLMIMTNRFQRVMTETLNLNETNFRILAIDMTQIEKETNCFASCKDNCNKHHPPWHGHGHGRYGHGRYRHGRYGHGRYRHSRYGHGRRWHGKPWHGKPWYGICRPWYFDKDNKYDNYDKCIEYDKHDKYDEYDKYDKYDKYN